MNLTLMDEFNNKDSPKNAMIAALEEGQYEGKKGSERVRGYPTIRLVKNGKLQKEYQGSRDEAALKLFIDKNFIAKFAKIFSTKPSKRNIKRKGYNTKNY